MQPYNGFIVLNKHQVYPSFGFSFKIRRPSFHCSFILTVIPINPSVPLKADFGRKGSQCRITCIKEDPIITSRVAQNLPTYIWLQGVCKISLPFLLILRIKGFLAVCFHINANASISACHGEEGLREGTTPLFSYSGVAYLR